MKQLGLIKTAACATLLLGAVRADTWDRKTTIIFSDAVQIPGATLPAGKYIFKLWDSQSDRYVVQIFNERQNHVYATLLTIPEYRMNPPDQTVISFYEAPAGQPQPIKAWFYPGDHNGREFIYSKAEANTIASVAHENVPSDVTAVSENALVYAPQPPPAVDPDADANHSADDDSYVAYPAATAPVVTQPESTQESPMVDGDTTDQDSQPAPAPQDPPATDSTMPSTGSELPLAALIGLSSIGAAFSVRAIRSARRNEVG